MHTGFIRKVSIVYIVWLVLGIIFSYFMESRNTLMGDSVLLGIIMPFCSLVVFTVGYKRELVL